MAGRPPTEYSRDVVERPDRIRIEKWSADARPYANLLPLVEALANHGNEASGPFVLDQSGWWCRVARPIDFDFIDANFDLPPSITLGRGHDTVLDRLSWSAIIGPGSVVDLRETS